MSEKNTFSALPRSTRLGVYSAALTMAVGGSVIGWNAKATYDKRHAEALSDAKPANTLNLSWQSAPDLTPDKTTVVHFPGNPAYAGMPASKCNDIGVVS